MVGEIQNVKDIKGERLTLKDVLFRQMDRIGSQAPNVLQSGLTRITMFTLHDLAYNLHSLVKPRADEKYKEKYCLGEEGRLPPHLSAQALVVKGSDTAGAAELYFSIREWIEDAYNQTKWLGIYTSVRKTIICENAEEIIADNPEIARLFVLDQLKENSAWLEECQDKKKPESEPVEEKEPEAVENEAIVNASEVKG